MALLCKKPERKSLRLLFLIANAAGVACSTGIVSTTIAAAVCFFLFLYAVALRVGYIVAGTAISVAIRAAYRTAITATTAATTVTATAVGLLVIRCSAHYVHIDIALVAATIVAGTSFIASHK